MDQSNRGMTEGNGLPALDIYDPMGYAGERRYSVVGELREQQPPLAVDDFGSVHLLRYEDVKAAHVDARRFLAPETTIATFMGLSQGPYYDFQEHSILTQNPPRHTRIRAVAARYFTRRRVEQLKDTIRGACDRLIDAFPEDETFEFGGEFAFKLPIGAIMGMMRLPEGDEEKIREWSSQTLPVGPGSEDATNEANRRMREYVEGVIEERRARPLKDDIISDLAGARDREELDDDELWALLVSLVMAGHATTTSALSLGMLHLLRNPDQMEWLREDRTMIRNAVEEVLRYESIVGANIRLVGENVEMYGVELEAGSVVCLNLASANHDPRKFDNPDRFDVTRPNARKHLTLGAGIHRCLGAPLAQFEMPVAFDTLFDRLESVELAGEPQYSRTFSRGLSYLPLRIRRKRKR